MPPCVAVMLLFSTERDFSEEVAWDREWYRVGELWRGISPGADVGNAGLWETRKQSVKFTGAWMWSWYICLGEWLGQVMADSAVTNWHCQVHVSFSLLPELLCVPKWQLLSDSIFYFLFWFSEQPLGQPHVLQPGRNLV